MPELEQILEILNEQDFLQAQNTVRSGSRIKLIWG